MDKERFINQFVELTDPEVGNDVSLDEDDEQLIDAYNKGYDKLSEDTRLFAFRNVIRSLGRCGFAGGGGKQYLLNSDRNGRYRVTVRTRWRYGIEHGTYDRIHIMEAGGKKYLGCTDSGRIPVTYYTRQVVGEVRL